MIQNSFINRSLKILWISEQGATPTCRHQLFTAFTADEAFHVLATGRMDAVIFCLPNYSASDAVIDQLRQELAGSPLFIYDCDPDGIKASHITKLGTSRVFDDSTSAQDILAAVVAEVHARRKSSDNTTEPWRRTIVGRSVETERVCETIRLIGPRRASVLIQGESGTGKEIVARAIHMASSRAEKPFVAINCGAIPETLIESELFGYNRGAFTGAVQSRAGVFEQAHGGTLFLDEIGELPIQAQSKLLRVLQERSVQRLGSTTTTSCDVRIIAATNAKLALRVRNGQFREDLFFRLNVIPIELTALRHRPDDILDLAEYFVGQVCFAESLPQKTFSEDARGALLRHAWPGNVRELQNAVEAAVIMSHTRSELIASDFPLPLFEEKCSAASRVRVGTSGIDFLATMAELEQSLFNQAMTIAGGNRTRAASLLGLKRTTFSARLRVLELAA
jgi:transcriptional regulator with PAS, ATPase and Fis domain